MGNNPEYRTDVSMTLFLTDDYEGGELELLWSNGYAQKVKEPAGTLVYYPSGVMHQVLPVIKGRRVAMVGWFQSHIPNPQERELLSEVTTLCEEMESHENQSYRHRRAISLKHNLFRMFWRNNAG
jgi:PKHD-type hydroxylase